MTRGWKRDSKGLLELLASAVLSIFASLNDCPSLLVEGVGNAVNLSA